MGQSLGQGGILEGGSSSSAAVGDGDPNENPPVGCNPDAIKLFIGNVPKSFTEEQLCPFFETAGQVGLYLQMQGHPFAGETVPASVEAVEPADRQTFTG